MSVKGFKLSDGTVVKYDYSALENIETDDTLSRSGVAADGKVVGDEITDLKEDLTLKADLPTETIENVSIASFTDGAEDVPIKELKVAIEPIQSGSGDPSPTNVRPISGRDSVTVTRTGKNLFNVDDLEANIFVGTAIRNGIRYDKPGTYTVSAQASGDFMYARVFNSDGTTKQTYFVVSGNTITNGTFTIANGEWFVIYDAIENTLAVSKTNFNRWKCQLEVSSSATSYEDYTADSYPIPLSSTIYGGTLDVGTGALTVDRAMVDLGTLDWSRGSYNDLSYFLTSSIAGVVKKQPAYSIDNVISDIYTAVMNAGVTYLAKDYTMFIYFSNGTLYCRNDDYTDATAFKTAMDGVQLCYEVATPTTVQLTPAQVTTLLKDNNIFADSGDVKKLIYRADLGAYIEKLINA